GSGAQKGGAPLLQHYACCSKPAYRFNLEPPPVGCVTGDHHVDEDAEDPQTLLVLQLQRKLVTYQDWRQEVYEETRNFIEAAKAKSRNGSG
ncbi:unnamed protein product, partial [Discosporangium mesarthrocarpum]